MTKLLNLTGVLTPTETNVVLLRSQQGVVLGVLASGDLQEVRC